LPERGLPERGKPERGGSGGGEVGVFVFLISFIAMFILFVLFESVKRKTKQLRLVHLGSGKMVADGTEQIVFEFVCQEPFVIDGYVNLKEMEAGDVIVIREYVKLAVDKEYGLYDDETYSGAQERPMVYVRPKPSIYGAKITLQQTAGVFKSFEWEFYKGVTS